MKSTKKLGIIGGMGTRAGISFMNKVVDYSPAVRDQEFIEIILHNNSSIPDRTRAIIHGECSPLDEILRSIRLFNENRVDMIVLACNTSYFFFDQFAPFANADILHPMRIVREEIRRYPQRIRKVGLLATTGTIQSGIFHRELEPYGLEVLTLPAKEQEFLFMASVYMENGLKSSRISQEARTLMFRSRDILLDSGAEVIVGGCTEVPLVLHEQNVPVPFIDPMDLLARRVVEACYGAVNVLSLPASSDPSEHWQDPAVIYPGQLGRAVTGRGDCYRLSTRQEAKGIK